MKEAARNYSKRKWSDSNFVEADFLRLLVSDYGISLRELDLGMYGFVNSASIDDLDDDEMQDLEEAEVEKEQQPAEKVQN